MLLKTLKKKLDATETFRHRELIGSLAQEVHKYHCTSCWFDRTFRH